MNEVRRLFGKRILVLLFVGFLVNLSFFLYSQTKGSSFIQVQQQAVEYNQLVKEYTEQNYKKAASDMEKTIRQIEKGTRQGDLVLLRRIHDKLLYLHEYPQSVQNIFTNAKQLALFSVFNNPDSYSFHNIQKTAKDFQKVRDVYPVLDEDIAVERIGDYSMIYYITFALLLVILYKLMEERQNGMWNIVHVGIHGRCLLHGKRFWILTVCSFFITSILFLSVTVSALWLYGGYGDLNHPIQSIEKYAQFPYPLSKIQYLAYEFLVSWFALWTLIMVIWMLFTIIRNRNNALVCLALFTGIEVILYKVITVHSAYNALHYINVMNLFHMNDILRKYQNWGFGKVVLSVLTLILVGMGVVALIAVSLSIIIYGKMRPEAKQNIFDITAQKIGECYQKIFSDFNIVLKELHKLIFSGKGLGVISIVILLTIYFTATGKMQFEEAALQRDLVYLQRGGKDYSMFREEVTKKFEEGNEAEQKLRNAAPKLDSGELSLDDYLILVNAFQIAKEERKSIAEYVTKIQYLDSIKTKYGVEGYLMSDRGYEEVFGQYSINRETILMLLSLFAIILIVSESLSIEYTSGMIHMLKCTKRGRTWLFCRKAGAMFIFTMLLFVVIYGIDFIILYHFYGFPYLLAPIMSLTFMEGCPFQVTVWQWILLLLFIKLAIFIGTAGITMFVSVLLGKKGNKAVVPMLFGGATLGIILLLRTEITANVLISIVFMTVGLVAVAVTQNIWAGRWNSIKIN